MGFDDTFGDVRSLALDTSSIIYFVEKHPAYFEKMLAVIKLMEAGKIQGVASVIVLTEVLVYPLRRKQFELVSDYKSILRRSRHLTLVSVTQPIAQKAAELRANYNIRTPDSIHLATAIVKRCDAFLTNDKDLSRIQEVSVIPFDSF